MSIFPSHILSLLLLLSAALSVHMPTTAFADEASDNGADTVAEDDEDNPKAKALKLNQEAAKLYAAGEPLKAVALLQEAYSFDPDPVLAFNIAKGYDDGGQLTKSKNWYRIALEGSLPAEQRSQAVRALERIERTQASMNDGEATTVQLNVRADVEGAEVFVNGKSTGLAPISLTVDPGSFAIRVTAPGHVAYEEFLEAEAGEKLKVSAALRPMSAEHESLTPWIYTFGAIALVTGGAGLAGDILASQAYEDAENARGDASEVAKLKSHGASMQILAFAGYGIGAASLLTTAVLVGIELSATTSSDDSTVGQRSTISIVPGIQGASLRLTW